MLHISVISHQHRRAYRLHRMDFGPNAILRQLKKEFKQPVSTRTVASWVGRFKILPGPTLELDAPFEWSRMEEYGLPWDASDYLLKMWAAVKKPKVAIVGEQTLVVQPNNLNLSPQPTVRQVRWWWRVHKAAPELSETEVIRMAYGFETRELGHEVLGIRMQMDDLEAYLAFKPWTSKESNLSYSQAIKEGRIPELHTQGADDRDQLQADVLQEAEENGLEDMILSF